MQETVKFVREIGEQGQMPLPHQPVHALMVKLIFFTSKALLMTVPPQIAYLVRPLV